MASVELAFQRCFAPPQMSSFGAFCLRPRVTLPINRLTRIHLSLDDDPSCNTSQLLHHSSRRSIGLKHICMPHHRVQIWSPIHTKRTILSLEDLARNSTSQSLSTMSWLDMQTRQAGVLPQEALRDGLSVDFLQPLGNRAGVHGVNAQLNLPYCSRVRTT